MRLDDFIGVTLVPVLVGLVIIGVLTALAYVGLLGWIIGGALVVAAAWLLGIMVVLVIEAATRPS